MELLTMIIGILVFVAYVIFAIRVIASRQTLAGDIASLVGFGMGTFFLYSLIPIIAQILSWFIVILLIIAAIKLFF